MHRQQRQFPKPPRKQSEIIIKGFKFFDYLNSLFLIFNIITTLIPFSSSTFIDSWAWDIIVRAIVFHFLHLIKQLVSYEFDPFCCFFLSNYLNHICFPYFGGKCWRASLSRCICVSLRRCICSLNFRLLIKILLFNRR